MALENMETKSFFGDIQNKLNLWVFEWDFDGAENKAENEKNRGIAYEKLASFFTSPKETPDKKNIPEAIKEQINKSKVTIKEWKTLYDTVITLENDSRRNTITFCDGSTVSMQWWRQEANYIRLTNKVEEENDTGKKTEVTRTDTFIDETGNTYTKFFKGLEVWNTEDSYVAYDKSWNPIWTPESNKAKYNTIKQAVDKQL